MTRKDYENTAYIIRMQLKECTDAGRIKEYGDGAKEAIKQTAERFANMFENDNPRFDRDKFLKACGIH